jgi:hypothetical protein
VDPDAGVQLPGVAPEIPAGVDQVATAPAWLVAVTLSFEGTRMVFVKLAPDKVASTLKLNGSMTEDITAPLSVAPVRLALVRSATRTSLLRFAPLRLAPASSASPSSNGGNGGSLMTAEAKNTTPVRFASVRLASDRSVNAQSNDEPPTQVAKEAPEKSANERLRPLRFAPARAAPGQLVKRRGGIRDDDAAVDDHVGGCGGRSRDGQHGGRESEGDDENDAHCPQKTSDHDPPPMTQSS